MKLLIGLLLSGFMLTGAAFASPITVDVISAPQGVVLQNVLSNLTFPTYQVSEQVLSQSNAVTVSNKRFDVSSNVAKQAYGMFDFSVSGGLSNARISLALNLPNKAIIKDAFVDTIIQPTSGGTPTIAISCQTPGDIIAAHTIAGWTVGQGIGSPAGSSATVIKLTAATNCSVDLGTTNLTAGKFAVWLSYVISQ